MDCSADLDVSSREWEIHFRKGAAKLGEDAVVISTSGDLVLSGRRFAHAGLQTITAPLCIPTRKSVGDRLDELTGLSARSRYGASRALRPVKLHTDR